MTAKYKVSEEKIEAKAPVEQRKGPEISDMLFSELNKLKGVSRRDYYALKNVLINLDQGLVFNSLWFSSPKMPPARLKEFYDILGGIKKLAEEKAARAARWHDKKWEGRYGLINELAEMCQKQIESIQKGPVLKKIDPNSPLYGPSTLFKETKPFKLPMDKPGD